MGGDSKNNINDNGYVASGPLQIPVASKKIVQSLKEILSDNFTDSEIYAALLDCHMDSDDAVQRLLSLDAFKEVKSRRERRKEMKETQESRSQNNSGTASYRLYSVLNKLLDELVQKKTTIKSLVKLRTRGSWVQLLHQDPHHLLICIVQPERL